MDKQCLEITWTENAVADYNNIINYLVENWYEKIIIDFNDAVQNKLNLLSANPQMGVASEKINNVRSILVTKHNRLYYRVKNDTIELLNILDTRQNPIKSPY